MAMLGAGLRVASVPYSTDSSFLNPGCVHLSLDRAFNTLTVYIYIAPSRAL